MKAKHNRIHEMRYSFFYSNPLHKIKFIKFRFHSCRDAAIIIETHKHTRVRARDEEKKVTKQRASTVFLIQFFSKKFCAVISCSPHSLSHSLPARQLCSFCVFSMRLLFLLFFLQAPSGLFFHICARIKIKINFDEEDLTISSGDFLKMFLAFYKKITNFD